MYAERIRMGLDLMFYLIADFIKFNEIILLTDLRDSNVHLRDFKVFEVSTFERVRSMKKLGPYTCKVTHKGKDVVKLNKTVPKIKTSHYEGMSQNIYFPINVKLSECV